MNYPVHIVSVGGLIENNEGKILLIKSPERGWEIPGGQVEPSEGLTDALKREIKEETGIDIEVGELKAVHSNITKRVQPDGITPIGSIVSFEFTRGKVRHMLSSEKKVAYVVFSRNPYQIHSEEFL